MTRHSLAKLPRFVCWFVLLVGGGGAQAQSGVDPRALDDTLATLVRKGNVPGAQVLVFSRDRVLYRKNLGYQHLETKTPVTDSTLFRLGSITKSLVAVSALQLVEEGKLDLQGRVRELAPDVEFHNPWEETDPVRVVHLLEHTSGFDDIALAEYAASGEGKTLAEGLAFNPRSRTSRWRPGTFFAYANSGPAVVARIIERITGNEFEAHVQQRILHPLGMHNATFGYDGAAPRLLATNYSNDTAHTPEPYWHILMRPAGSLNSSAESFRPFVQMLMNRGTLQGVRILDSASVLRMERPTASLAAEQGSTLGYGLNNYTSVYKGYVFHGHDGGVNNGQASYLYSAELDLGLIIAMNTGGPAIQRLTKATLAAFLDSLPSRVPPRAPIPAAELAEMEGVYRVQWTRNSITDFIVWLLNAYHLNWQTDRLVHRPVLSISTTEWRRVAPRHYLVLTDSLSQGFATLVTTEDGNLALAGEFANSAKTSGWAVWLSFLTVFVALLVSLCGVLAGVVWLILHRSQGRRLSAFGLRMALWACSLCVLVWMVAWIVGGSDPLDLGHFGVLPVLIASASLGIPLATLAAVVLGWRSLRTVPSAWDRFGLVLFLVAAVVLTVYLGAFGHLGYRPWA